MRRYYARWRFYGDLAAMAFIVLAAMGTAALMTWFFFG